MNSEIKSVTIWALAIVFVVVSIISLCAYIFISSDASRAKRNLDCLSTGHVFERETPLNGVFICK